MNLVLLKECLTVCQLPPGAAIPAWAASAGGFVSITRTAEELSIVCRNGIAPPDAKQVSGWRAFQVEGPLDFSLTGILASLLDPLARADISTFAIATYNTDYILVRDAQAEAAAQALRQAGHAIRAD